MRMSMKQEKIKNKQVKSYKLNIVSMKKIITILNVIFDQFKKLS